MWLSLVSYVVTEVPDRGFGDFILYPKRLVTLLDEYSKHPEGPDAWILAQARSIMSDVVKRLAIEPMAYYHFSPLVTLLYDMYSLSRDKNIAAYTYFAMWITMQFEKEFEDLREVFEISEYPELCGGIHEALALRSMLKENAEMLGTIQSMIDMCSVIIDTEEESNLENFFS